MRRSVTAALLLAICLVSRGGRELENVELVGVLGVDGARPVALTALGDGEEPQLYHARGQTAAQAQEVLEGAGAKRLEITHVSELVLGRDADVGETLYQEVIHRKSGCAARVWLVGEGTAEELLAGVPTAAQRLASLRENAGAQCPTLMEALRALRREGHVTLPVLAAEDGELTVTGYETVRGSWSHGG